MVVVGGGGMHQQLHAVVILTFNKVGGGIVERFSVFSDFSLLSRLRKIQNYENKYQECIFDVLRLT